MTMARRSLLEQARSENGIRTMRLQGAEGAEHLESTGMNHVDDSAAFDLVSRSIQVGYYVVRDTLMTPARMDGPAHLDGPEPRIFFTFVVSGAISIRQSGRTRRVGVGEACILFEHEHYTISVLERSRFISVGVPARAADSRGVVADTKFKLLSSSQLLVSSARAFFLGLFRAQAFPLQPVEQIRATRAIDSLLLSLLALAQESTDHTRSKSAVERSVITSFISTHFTSPELSTSTVAAHYGMSTRSLQRLFSEVNQSVSENIQQRRLEHAVAILLDDRFVELSVEGVALRSGFAGSDQLRRAIAQEMGTTPTELRQKAMHRESVI